MGPGGRSRPGGRVRVRSMASMPPELAGHPDRLRWNARYSGVVASFAAHPLAGQALPLPLPDGPVLDRASGASGSGLGAAGGPGQAAAGAGRQVTAVDAAEVALRLLGGEAERRRLSARITLVHADLAEWRPEPG